MQRRVSVIIPVYNIEEYLPRCIESIIGQTYTDWEIILVDDGSTDRSGEICDEYANSDDRIKSFHKANGGVSSARNEGLSQACGEYICFIDGDDWISNCMFEYLVRDIEDDGSDMSMCRIKLMDSFVDEAADDYESIKKYTQDSQQYLVDNFLNHGNSCCAKLFKRDQLTGIEFQQGHTIGEDMLFLLKARERFTKVSVLEFSGYYYLQLPSSAMNKSFKPSFMDEIYCWQQALAELGGCEQHIIKKVKAIIIVAAFQVLQKLAFEQEVKDKKSYLKVCENAIKDNSSGFMNLSNKEKVEFALARISVLLYMSVYKITKKRD